MRPKYAQNLFYRRLPCTNELLYRQSTSLTSVVAVSFIATIYLLICPLFLVHPPARSYNGAHLCYLQATSVPSSANHIYAIARPNVLGDFEYKKRDCSRTNFPLRLAYNITVHKAQGSTSKQVVLNMERKDHSLGLSYIAIS
jgi:hypothetical protein